jgi:hypothetical protein
MASTVNAVLNALRKELLQIRRRRLSEEIDRLRSMSKPVSTAEIVRLIRKDRDRFFCRRGL